MRADYEALEPETFLPLQPGHHYTLTGEFADLRAAQAACQVLQSAHVADGHVEVLGLVGDEVRTDWGLSFDDRIALGTMALRVGVGALAGTLVGGLLNLSVGLLSAGAGTGTWAAAVGGALLGMGVGAMVGGVSAFSVWENQEVRHRHHPELDHALVGIETDDPAELARAETLLRDLAPVRIDRLAAAGACT